MKGWGEDAGAGMGDEDEHMVPEWEHNKDEESGLRDKEQVLVPKSAFLASKVNHEHGELWVTNANDEPSSCTESGSDGRQGSLNAL